MTGILADRISSSSSGFLSLHNANTNRWQPFDPHQTIFQDALSEGYNTGVVGWFNPYCRILPSVLDRCYWTDHIVVVEPGLYDDNRLRKRSWLRYSRPIMLQSLSCDGRSKHDRDTDLGSKLISLTTATSRSPLTNCSRIRQLTFYSCTCQCLTPAVSMTAKHPDSRPTTLPTSTTSPSPTNA